MTWRARMQGLGPDYWRYLGASCLYDFGLYVFYLLYNLYLLDRGYRDDFLGLVSSFSTAGCVAGTIPAALLVKRLGLRRVVLVSFPLMGLVTAARVVAVGSAPLLATAFLGGVVFSVWAVSISPAVARLTNPENRPFGFSLAFSTSIGVGILGGFVGGRLPGWLAETGVAIGQTKPAALLVGCGIVMLAALPARRLRFPADAATEKKLYPRSPFLRRYLAALVVWSIATGAFNPFFNAYFAEQHKMTADRIGLVYAFSQLSQVVAMLLAPVIFHRFGLVTGIMFMQAAAGVALAGLASGPGSFAAAAIYAGYMAFQWMSEPGMYSLLMNQFKPGERAGASALNFLVLFSTQALAAAVAGWALARFGYPVVLGGAACAAFLAAILFRALLGNSVQTTATDVE